MPFPLNIKRGRERAVRKGAVDLEGFSVAPTNNSDLAIRTDGDLMRRGVKKLIRTIKGK